MLRFGLRLGGASAELVKPERLGFEGKSSQLWEVVTRCGFGGSVAKCLFCRVETSKSRLYSGE